METVFDSFFVVDALAVISVVILDLSLSRDARVAAAARIRERLTLLKKTPTTALVTLSSASLQQASGRVFGQSALCPRFIVLALMTSALTGVAVLFVGALVSARDASAMIVPAMHFFALPAIACGYLALTLDHWLFAMLARQSSLLTQLTLLLLGLSVTLTLWLALMHGGTWLEWQHKRTPLAYGSEWFYAEVYWHYLREPAGRLVSLAAGIVVAWPVALLVVWAAALLGLKLVRVPLDYLLEVFQRAGRGVFTASGICIGIVAKLVQEAMRVL